MYLAERKEAKTATLDEAAHKTLMQKLQRWLWPPAEVDATGSLPKAHRAHGAAAAEKWDQRADKEGKAYLRDLPQAPRELNLPAPLAVASRAVSARLACLERRCTRADPRRGRGVDALGPPRDPLRSAAALLVGVVHVASLLLVLFKFLL